MDGELEPFDVHHPINDAGVTLIELMVVVAVMAVLAVGASIAAMGGRDASDLAWFRTQFDTARALAIQSNQRRGLYVAADGITAAHIAPEGWQQGSKRAWAARVTFRVDASGTVPNAPNLLFLPSGQTTPFSIAFASGHTCQSDGWTGLTCAE